MIKALETPYNGCLFRSRLEARWAVFYDHLGIQWEYEKQGYKLEDGTCYLPDFWLPEQRYWIEIKGRIPIASDEAKLVEVCKDTEASGFLFWGSMPPGDGTQPDQPGWDDSAVMFDPRGPPGQVYRDFPGEWCACEYCRIVGVRWSGYASRLPCNCVDGDGKPSGDRYGDEARVQAAYKAARRARF